MSRSLFKSTLIAATATASALTFGSAASAAVLFSDTAAFANQITELEGFPQLTLDKFDATGYNVTKVTVSLDSGALTSSGSVTNLAAQAQSFSILTLASFFNLTADGTTPASSFNTSNILIGSQGYTNLAPNSPAAFGAFTGNLTPSSQIFTSGSDISQFLGTGTFSFSPFTTIGTTIFGGGGNILTNIETFASASVTVTYEGEELPPPPPPQPVPEPSTIVGLLIAGGLGTWAKAKRRNAANLEA